MLRNKLPSSQRQRLSPLSIEHTENINCEIMFDSGAFTAWTKKENINIDDYIAYIKKYKEYFTYYINLDVIPGEFGRIPSEIEIRKSAQQSWDNLCYIEKQGLTPIPVFHQGEDLLWLEKLISSGHNYVGISPANDRTTQQKILWLNEVFSLICVNNVPVIKTHAFGSTSPVILSKFPFTSADSQTWSKAGSLGTIIIPELLHTNNYDYETTPTRLFISKNSPTITKRGEHYYTLNKNSKNEIDYYIQHMGFTPEELSVSWKKRDLFNIKFFLELEKQLQKNKKIHFYFATTWTNEKNEQLSIMKVKKRLISFYYNRKEYTEENFKLFKKSGLFIFPPKKERLFL